MYIINLEAGQHRMVDSWFKQSFSHIQIKQYLCASPFVDMVTLHFSNYTLKKLHEAMAGYVRLVQYRIFDTSIVDSWLPC
jgi:hypothetical protein